MTPDDEQIRARKRRSWVIALGLIAFVALVYAVTMIRMGGDVINRPL